MPTILELNRFARSKEKLTSAVFYLESSGKSEIYGSVRDEKQNSSLVTFTAEGFPLARPRHENYEVKIKTFTIP